MTMLKSPAPVKRLEVMNLLREKIRAGRYRYGDRLPSVQELTGELAASYVTVNRAIKLLEQDGYIECRHGVGNFVCCQEAAPPPTRKLVNLICPADVYEQREELTIRFLRDGAELFQTADWEVRSCPIQGDFSEARPFITDPDAYSLVFGFRPYWQNFTASLDHVRNRVILIGERSETDGITCITSDETQTIRLALDHLAEQGMHRTALVCANLHSHLEMQRAAAWRSLCLENGRNFDWCRRFCLDMELPAMAPTEAFVLKHFESLAANGGLREIDALITPDDDVAAHWIGVLLDHGIRVPEDIAVVSIGNSALSRLFRPQITSVDHNFDAHLATAFAIVESRLAGHADQMLFHLCQPRLIVRASSSRKITHPETVYHNTRTTK